MDTFEEIMKALDITADEAKELKEADKAIDRGEKLFELPKDLEAGAKKARRAETAKRKPKTNTAKASIIDLFISCLTSNKIKNLVVANPEREFTFEMEGVRYKVVLSCPRT